MFDDTRTSVLLRFELESPTFCVIGVKIFTTNTTQVIILTIFDFIVKYPLPPAKSETPFPGSLQALRIIMVLLAIYNFVSRAMF
jgi:hypothetical protein